MAFSPETYGAVLTLIEESLVGAGAIKGQDGAPGVDGKDGVDGKSAYDIAVDNGFEGTEEEWIQSISGLNDEVKDYIDKEMTEVDTDLAAILDAATYICDNLP